MRIIFSILLFLILILSGFLFYMDYGPISAIPVLRYEHISDIEEKLPGYVHPRAFKDQMKFLADDKFKVIPLREVAEIYRKKGKIPQHTIAITFDGGYDDFVDAAGVLAKYKFPATVFLQSSNVGKKGYMTKDQILTLLENELITLGSNGQTGRDLTRLTGAEAYGEIFSSRTALEKELEIPIQYFSFPQGGVNRFLASKVEESRYLGACALLPGKSYPNRHPYVIKRLTITPREDNPIFFKLKTWGNYILLEEWRRERNKKVTPQRHPDTRLDPGEGSHE